MRTHGKKYREIAASYDAAKLYDALEAATIVKRNAKKEAAKRDRVKKGKAKSKKPDEKAPAKKHPDDVIFAELKSECSANFRRAWAAATTKVRRRFLREVLKWQGGKPVAEAHW